MTLNMSDFHSDCVKVLIVLNRISKAQYKLHVVSLYSTKTPRRRLKMHKFVCCK